MAILENEIKESIVHIVKILYLKNYITSMTGNVSARAPNSRLIWITPSATSVPKHKITSEDLIAVDIDSEKIIEGKYRPSIETPMHIRIYRTRPDINAVIHVHDPLPLALAEEGVSIIEEEDIEAKLLLGYTIAIIPRLKPGTLELANSVAKAMKKCNIAILLSHGIVAIGTTIYEALSRIETLNHIAMKRFIKYLMRSFKSQSNDY